MDLPHIPGLPVVSWGEVARWIFTAIGGVTVPTVIGWWFVYRSQNLDGRRQKAAERSDEARQLLALSGMLSAEVAKAKAEIARYSAEIELLRAARWSIDEVLLQLHSAAIAARTMVHDLQRELGLPETAFPPLPQPSWTVSKPPDPSS